MYNDDKATEVQSRPQNLDYQFPQYHQEPRDNNKLVKVLIGAVLALVTLVTAGAVILLMSQSTVSTHINRSASNNTSNATTTNKGPTQPEKIIVQQQPAPTVTQTQTVTTPNTDSGSTDSTDTVSSQTPDYCSTGVYVGSASCGFGENVFDAVYSDWKDNGHEFPSNLYAVHSPASGKDYDLSLVSSSASYALYYSGSAGAYVTVGEHALEVY